MKISISQNPKSRLAMGEVWSVAGTLTAQMEEMMVSTLGLKVKQPAVTEIAGPK